VKVNPNKMYKINLILLLAVNLLVISAFAQNVAITDDDTYVASSSAMLDVKSVSKGFLIPRLTTVQRTSITSPSTSLLVFDTNLNSFYFWNGTAWTNLTSGSASGIWAYNSPNVYLNNATDKLGVGTSTPKGKMEVKSDVSLGIDDPIFQVVNNNGDTVFAVFQSGVRVNVEDGVGKATGSKGGFAVGGFSPSKGLVTNEFLRVTPDSVRIYIEDDPAKATGSKGGFAVGGFSPSKTTVANYMDMTPQNYFIGHEAGIYNGTGISNLFLGFNAGKANSGGNNNIYMGHYSGLSAVDCSHNVFLGSEAGKFTNNTYGSGAYGSYNVLVGRSAGYTNTNGYSNAFLGDQAGYFNTSGYYNTFLGAESGLSNTTGTENIYIGYRSGPNANAIVTPPSGHGTGGNNICLGNNSGVSISSGYNNVYLGLNTGFSNTIGNTNLFMGNYAGYDNTTGSNNIFMGNSAGSNNTTGSFNTYIGEQTGLNCTLGERNIYIGYHAGYSSAESNGWDNICMGNSAGFSMTSGYNNHFIGLESGYSNTSGQDNVFIGKRTGYSNLSGGANVFLGTISGYNNTTGQINVFIGNETGRNNTTGGSNVFIGYQSGYSNDNGGWNSFYGTYSGYSNVSGEYNLYMGNQAGKSNVDGVSNIYLGNYAGGLGTTGSNNVFIGDGAGYVNTGTYNTFIGNGSGSQNFTGSNNVFVGNDAGKYEAGSNKLYIDNTQTSTPLIYGDFITRNTVINGNFKVTNILYDKDSQAGTSGQVLSSTGTATDWITLPTAHTGSGTANQVAFWTGASALSSNSKLYWDNTNARLGINATPSYKFHVVDDNTGGDAPAIYGIHAVTNNYGVGVLGKGGYKGVVAENTSTSGSNYGVFTSSTGVGTGTNYGIYSEASGGSTNWAGWFVGNVHVTGNVTKSGGTFRIDHPLDPENKYLSHSFVESPDMMNIYNGVIILDANGEATVTLPNYFNTLNKDYRYQLTPIGASMPNLYVKEEVNGNTFKIAGGESSKKVSWEVTGIRQDPYAVKYPVIVEEEKQVQDKGFYLNPDVYNLPKSKAIYSERK